MTTRYRTPPTDRQRLLVGIGFILLGCLSLVMMGTLESDPTELIDDTANGVPAWVGACAGLSFVFAGASLVLRVRRFTQAANVAGAVAGLKMLVTLVWVVLR